MCMGEGGVDDVWGGGEGRGVSETRRGRKKGGRGSGVKACTLFECLSESRWAASSNRVHSEVTTTSL